MLPRFYAPDIDICGVVDHLTREPDSSNIPRNALVEAARMSRPTIKPLCECEPSSAEALIIPGGFGAARTLLVKHLSKVISRKQPCRNLRPLFDRENDSLYIYILELSFWWSIDLVNRP